MHRQPGHAGRAALTPKPFEVAFELSRLDLSWGRPRHPRPPPARYSAHIILSSAGPGASHGKRASHWED